MCVGPLPEVDREIVLQIQSSDFCGPESYVISKLNVWRLDCLVCDPFLGFQHPAEEARPFLGPCWMDDLAIPIAGDTAESVISKTGVLASLLLDKFVSFATTPNLAAGKTEILMSLLGPGSRSRKFQFLGAHGGRCFPVLGEYGVYNIRVVTRYKHLGGVLHHCGDHANDLRWHTKRSRSNDDCYLPAPACR